MVEPSFPVSVPNPHKRCSWLQLRQAAGMWVSRLSAEVFLARRHRRAPGSCLHRPHSQARLTRCSPPCTEPRGATGPAGSQLAVWQHRVPAMPWSLRPCSSKQAPAEGQSSAKLHHPHALLSRHSRVPCSTTRGPGSAGSE